MFAWNLYQMTFLNKLVEINYTPFATFANQNFKNVPCVENQSKGEKSNNQLK